KFNEAHPVLAKFIQGTMMLVPALTLILAPLAVGIGLLKGYRAALFLVWQMVKPLALGLMVVSPVAWAVAAAIAGLAVGFTYAYKNIEPFRKAVDNTVTAIKGLFQLVFGSQI
ncbi:carbamoyl-phosphate synthase, partial [Bacillus cereus]